MQGKIQGVEERMQVSDKDKEYNLWKIKKIRWEGRENYHGGKDWIISWNDGKTSKVRGSWMISGIRLS